ncbi:MAG TPA: hypothetical protein DC024_05465 [Clostridiales bacterium]|jgi:hypothetical protein|nr:hypothetical protein [Clostridiales bacterium]
MSKQPFYHLRPNKCIDRTLFIQTLIGLSRQLPISDYRYTGFGSYTFEDFKLFHDTLNISSMVSLEREPNAYKRAEFNLPYGCIKVKNTGSTEYLSSLILDDGDHNIFWLDYVSPNELGTQLADYATLLNLLNPNDIIRITLNANPSSLRDSDLPDELHKTRLRVLKERVPEECFPNSIIPEDMTRGRYPSALLKIIKAITLQSLNDTPPYSPNFMFPLFSSVYADGQQMLTFTGIVLDSHDRELDLRKVLSDFPHNTFSWDDLCRIEIPALTFLEITELNKLLPNEDIRQQLIAQFPFIFSPSNGQALDSYLSYYKYYPNYHQVSF